MKQDEQPLRLIRSERRVKTVEARIVDGVLVVRAPARMDEDELLPIIERLRRRFERRQAAQELNDDRLHTRAQYLNHIYFADRLTWSSIRWVTNQEKRFGSCTPSNGTIRISHRLASVPQFVLDYVIVHELAHLLEANHSGRFWQLVNRYPKAERARGFLLALGMEELDA